MTRPSFETTSSPKSSPRRHRRSAGAISLAAFTVVALGLSSCGGGDDDDASDSTTSTLAATVAPTTTAAPTTTVPPTTTTTLDLVTEGATLIVANASGINGAAGRMTDELEVAGFSVGAATNSSEGQLETTKVYFDPENADAEEVADSVRLALGAGDIEVLEMGVPAPVESGETGDATIVVAMGNDVADKTLAVLQGREAPPATSSSGDSDEESDEETDEETDEEPDEETDVETDEEPDEETDEETDEEPVESEDG